MRHYRTFLLPLVALALIQGQAALSFFLPFRVFGVFRG